VGNVYTVLQQIYSEKLHIKFHQNRLSFIEDITTKHFGLFFPDTVYNNE